jgi:hypothetical protein
MQISRLWALAPPAQQVLRGLLVALLGQQVQQEQKAQLVRQVQQEHLEQMGQPAQLVRPLLLWGRLVQRVLASLGQRGQQVLKVQ